MITFKQHIEVSSYVDSDGDLQSYVDSLPLSERAGFYRDIKTTYPLNSMENRPLDGLSNFSVNTSIMSLVLGQFIMIEQIITGKTSFKTSAENDLALAKLIIRPKHHKEFDNENIEDEKRNEQEILNLDVRDVYAALARFLKDRDYVLFKQFSGVFYEVPEEDEEDKEETEEETTAENIFAQQWYWYSIVRMLAKEDITMYSKIYMLSMDVVMPEMSFLAQKGKIEAARQRQGEAMRKL